VATVVVEGSTEAGEGVLVLQENKAVYFLRTNQLPSTLE
jgi:hypothetical protein